MNIDKIINNGIYFYELMRKNENARFKSWEHCYKSFRLAYKNNNLNNECIDYLCLQLSFYLASWGMYRGSSFLLGYDYKIHKPVVELLFKYKSLWGIKIEKDKDQDLNWFYTDLFDLIDEIKEYYSKKRELIKKENSPKKEISDTLVSKILLGTIGCIPAYDRYFISGISNINVSSKALGVRSIKDLVEYYRDNYDKFESLRRGISTDDLEYTQMKILDSCFWQLGYNEERKK